VRKSGKIKATLGWEPAVDFETGLEKTVEWYLENEDWLDRVVTGEYEKYYEKQYLHR
jgi:dTDP-glucose 4,6-dehydratase